MKVQITQKRAKELGTVVRVGYCRLARLLNYMPPFAYSAGVYGWNCDYYDIGQGIIISTGYRPIGKPVSYDLITKYENLAQQVQQKGTPTDKRLKTKSLIENLAKELLLY